MKIGIVGYQGSGKSTLFHWLTGVAPDPSLSHTTQSAMATIPEPRIAELCKIYKPKKITQAALEIVDTPGLSRTHEGSAQKLAMIREAGRWSSSWPTSAGPMPRPTCRTSTTTC